MSASLTTLEAALKESYTGIIQSQLNNACALLAQFGEAEATLDASGKYAVVPFKLGRNSGVGAAGAGAALPTAGNQELEKLIINYRFVYGRFGFDGPSLAAMKKGNGAFGSVSEIEMDGLVDDVKKYQNICTFVGGPVIGLVWQKFPVIGGAGSADTFQYSGRSSAQGVPVGGANQIQLVRADTFAAVGAATGITAVTSTTLDLAADIFTGVGGAAVPDGVPMYVVHNSPALAVEPNGLLGVMGLADYYGISRVNETIIHAFDRTASAGNTDAALTLDDMDELMDSTGEAAGEEITQFWFHRRQRQSYTSILQGTNNANLYVDVKDAKAKADAGFEVKSSALAYNGVPIMIDVDCPYGTIFGINHKKWKRVTLREGGFDEDSGSILKPTPNQDGVEGFWKAYYQVFCQKPNGAGFVTGLK